MSPPAVSDITGIRYSQRGVDVAKSLHETSPAFLVQ
jgi:hypothetical protein